MNVTIKQILEAREALVNLGGQKLPIKASYKIAKIMKVINEELDNFSKLRQQIVAKHTVPGSLEMDNSAAMEELNELLTVEVEINEAKIDLSNSDIQLTPIEIINLDPFASFE